MQPNVRPIREVALVSENQELGPLDESGFTFSSTGLKIEPWVKFEDWERVGRKLQLADRCVQWAIGDWLIHGEHHYGDKYDQAVELTGFREQTLMNYRSVAKAFPPETYRRRENVDFATHAEVASLPPDEADRILARAAGDPRITRHDVRKEAQRIKRKLGQNPTELEVLHEPAVVDFLTTYIDALKEWEPLIPKSAPFLRNMLHAHIGQTQWQQNRTVESDCEAIAEMFGGKKGTEGVYRANDSDIFNWLQKVGYFMRDPEMDDRLDYMVEQKMLEVESVEESRQDGRKGVMVDIYMLHPSYLAKMKD